SPLHFGDAPPCHRSCATRDGDDGSMDMTRATTRSTMPPTAGSSTTTTAHVLVVDDDPSVRQMIADYLADNEVRVTTLASGREIADVMARETIDLLVLDLRLPGEDGMQIARKLR